MPAQGIGVLTRQTKQFIDQNPTNVVFSRMTKVADGAGGSTTAPTALAPQTVRLVRPQMSESVERRTVGGEVVLPTLVVIAMPTADINRGDTFQYLGLDMEVVWITDMGYELSCEAARR